MQATLPMKAAVYYRYGPPEVLKLQEQTLPVPKDDEVRVRIYATTVSAVDSFYRKGSPLLARLDAGLMRPKKATLGTDLAGVVDAIGKGVKRFKVGDAVFGATGGVAGTHATHICLPEEGVLVQKPDRLTYEEAAAAPYGAMTSVHFLRTVAQVQPGQRVLVNGASGAIGTFAVQLAKHLGAEVIGVCSTSNLQMVKSLGADIVIDYSEEDFTRNKQAYDVIFDTVGMSYFSRCKRALALGGIYLTTVPTLGGMLHMMWTSLVGTKRAKVAFAGLLSPRQKKRDLAYLRTLLEDGILTSYIDRTYTFEDIAEAHRYVDTGHKRGNVVLTIGNASRD